MEANFCPSCGVALKSWHCAQCSMEATMEPGFDGRLMFTDLSPKPVMQDAPKILAATPIEDEPPIETDPFHEAPAY